MPTASTTSPGAPAASSKAASGGSAKSSAPTPVVPFVRASARHREPTGIDVSRTLNGNTQDLGVFDVPAYGYVESLVILVQATGGVGAATAAEDYPFNSLVNIAFTEPNGATIYQVSSGYSVGMTNKWGGYRFINDPRSSPVAGGINIQTGGNFQYLVRIPVGLNLRDALGALPNQNAAASFKLRLALAANTTIYSSVPVTTQPSVRVRVFLEAWDQPEMQSGGAANQVSPPAVNTTGFWTEQIFNVNAGSQTIRLTRVGNYIRNLIWIYRRTAGTRANGQSDWPDPLSLFLDTRPLDIVEKNNHLQQMYERTGFGGALGTAIGTAGTVPAGDSAGGLDNGVFVYDFMHEFDGHLGFENRDLWLPTLGSTRLELQGSFANAGTLTVLTNDVAVAGPVFL